MENGFVNEEDEEYKVFLALHTAALKAARIPPLYWKSLHHKLKHEVKKENTVKHTGARETVTSASSPTPHAVKQQYDSYDLELCNTHTHTRTVCVVGV